MARIAMSEEDGRHQIVIFITPMAKQHMPSFRFSE